MKSIRFKIILLILILSLASFIGLVIFTMNAVSLRINASDFSEKYNESLAEESFNQFNSFLDTIQDGSGISQTLGEFFYAVKDKLGRRELAETMLNSYRTSFARELNMLGGGAFYEPNAFYPDVRDFHCFVSKVLSSGGQLPSEKEVRWAGDEWAWDLDTYEEGWYLSVLPKGWDRSRPRDTRYNWSELYVDESIDVLMVTIGLPIYSKNQQIVGVATIDISLSTLQKMITSILLPTPSTQIVGFSAINKAIFAVSGSDSYNIIPYQADSWMAHLSQFQPGQKYINNDFIYENTSYTLSVNIHDSGLGLAILVPNDEKHEAVNSLQTTTVVTTVTVGLVMIGIIIVIIFAISAWVVKPIKNASHVFENLAKGDLTQTFEIKGGDELAQMMRILMETQEGLKSMVNNIKNQSENLSDIGSNLAANTTETAAAVNEITANAQSIKNRIINQSASVTENHATMEQLMVNINKLNDHVKNQSENISAASSAIEEMVANIQSVSDNLIKNSGSIKTLNDVSEIGRTGLSTVSSDIQEISRESEGLMEINSVMNNIASQTNLLSMNAAIEAAHAGDAGKGFAVVADEIRKLAESSSEQSKTIGIVLKKIKESIDKISVSTTKVLNNFELINQNVKIVSQHDENIRYAMEEQGSGSKQILDGVSNVNEITIRVKNESHEMHEGAQEVIRESGNLEMVTQEIASGMNEMANGADHINQAMTHVSGLGNKIMDAIDLLKNEISRFKIE